MNTPAAGFRIDRADGEMVLRLIIRARGLTASARRRTSIFASRPGVAEAPMPMPEETADLRECDREGFWTC